MNKKTWLIGVVALLLVMLPTASALSFGGGGGGFGIRAAEALEIVGATSYGEGYYATVEVRTIEKMGRTTGGGYMAIKTRNIEDAEGPVVIKQTLTSPYANHYLEGVWYADPYGTGVERVPIRIQTIDGEGGLAIIVDVYNNFDYDGSEGYGIYDDVSVSTIKRNDGKIGF